MPVFFVSTLPTDKNKDTSYVICNAVICIIEFIKINKICAVYYVTQVHP